jgi:hypothetical protein
MYHETLKTWIRSPERKGASKIVSRGSPARLEPIAEGEAEHLGCPPAGTAALVNIVLAFHMAYFSPYPLLITSEGRSMVFKECEPVKRTPL